MSSTDWIMDDVAEAMEPEAKALLEDPAHTRTVTWTYHDTEPDAWNAAGGTVSGSPATDSPKGVRGNWRDSQSGALVVGRYWYIFPASSFPSGTPDTQDVITDGGESLTVNAIHRDPFGAFVRVDATRVQTSGAS